ncbi:MAG: hypothetical protein KAH06_08080, partial [Desulfobacterales bacterium]|nr:hypothetical protein [Desulfobacterales bacterium]
MKVFFDFVIKGTFSASLRLSVKVFKIKKSPAGKPTGPFYCIMSGRIGYARSVYFSQKRMVPF